MEILIWVVSGVIIGLLSSLVMTNSGGVALNAFTGAIGSVIAGWVTSMFTEVEIGAFDWYAFIAAVLGGMVLIGVVRMVRN